MADRRSSDKADQPLAPSRLLAHQIPDTEPPALVDYFKRIPSRTFVFYLSHFHSDHYAGLSRVWSSGVVHCSVPTGKLLTDVLRVDAKFVRGLEFEVEYEIGDAKVTLLDANHCPGAAMLLFKTREGNVYLHTGDFRYDPSMVKQPALSGISIHTLFLDTTYGNPGCVFRSQTEAINTAVDYVGEVVKDCSVRGQVPPLVLVGSYTIGKERIALALARAFGWKIFTTGRHRQILDCLELNEQHSMLFTQNARDARVHMVPMNVVGSALPYFRANFQRIQFYIQDRGLADVFSSVIGFLPTGWSFTKRWNKEHSTMTSGAITVRLLEYSEHSSYDELKQFVDGLRPQKVIPTVFSSQEEYARLFEDMQPRKKKTTESSTTPRTKKRSRGLVVEDRSQLKITSFFSRGATVSTTATSPKLILSCQCERSQHCEVIDISD
ncbi:dna repair metallo-beta-lactamase [Cystoisospora suis]|uniref:Dna repair metallo-beta-lactamase n=1 Tax=Cystoisospora suis TaxID=483139 RepID=A0A2C6L497_9APIC|nr:dna repair metallo-beta-lactamase [Cystoisospora suis]